MTARKGTVPVAVAAKVLGIDVQTLRLLLQHKMVDFGFAYKNPGSRHWSYLIWAEPFYLKTGYRQEEEVGE